ncbi:MAG: enoyl-CoA hydratase [Rhodospirillaceae bacterium]|nr:enoyl-CoA hydratase [Rhodospirillaceae bacterium]MBT6119594.1 enoyl-CoA hydratase [Rhodospirillaceae bacterium]
MSAKASGAKAEAVETPVLLRDDREGIATLTLNRPAQYNALSEALLAALQGALDEIREDRAVRVVVIAAAGKAFCAGHDLKEMRAKPSREYYGELFETCSRMMTSIVRLPQPVIARVHGLATAAGCQLVASCDLAAAAASARFATSGINAGLFCMTPGVAVGRTMHRKHALELLLTGEFVDADRAAEIGLVNRAVEDDALDEAVTGLARTIAAKSWPAIARGKDTFYRQMELGLDDAYALAGCSMADNMMFADAAEGIDAFIEKRKPNWRDE